MMFIIVFWHLNNFTTKAINSDSLSDCNIQIL